VQHVEVPGVPAEPLDRRCQGGRVGDVDGAPAGRHPVGLQALAERGQPLRGAGEQRYVVALPAEPSRDRRPDTGTGAHHQQHGIAHDTAT
jgi:hypothetical protein